MKPLDMFNMATCALLLCGCAKPIPIVDFYATDSETLRGFQRIEIVEQDAIKGSDMEVLGDVTGLYCHKGGGPGAAGAVRIDDPLARAQALDQVKLKAAALGADVVSPPRCRERRKSDVSNNCWATLTCTSTAARAKGG